MDDDNKITYEQMLSAALDVLPPVSASDEQIVDGLLHAAKFERDNMRRIMKRTQDEAKHIDEMSWKELRSNLRLAIEELASLRPALHCALCEVEELRARIVTLEAMR